MTIRAAFVCSKACDIVAEDAFSVASQHSISLVNIKWGTVMSPKSRCVTCYVQKIPACSHERFPMFEHNFLKAVGRTQIEGSCKVYVGKTNWKRSWKLCLCKQEKHLKHPRGWLLFQEHLVVPKHMTLLQKMRLALPVSIPASCFFDRQAICDRNSKGGIRGFPNWDWKISKQSLSISEHCKKTAHDTKWPCFFELFRSFLHFWSRWHQVSYFHARRGQICEFPTCSQWEVPACLYIP